MTNYVIKLEDPIWRQVAVIAEVFNAVGGLAIGSMASSIGRGDGLENKTRQFLIRVANRIFTKRPLL